MNYFKLTKLFFKYPVGAIRNINSDNLEKFIFALKTENPRHILRNIERFLSNDSPYVHSENGAELPQRIVDFITKLEILSSQNPNTTKALFVSHEATLTGAPLIIHRIAHRVHRVIH